VATLIAVHLALLGFASVADCICDLAAASATVDVGLGVGGIAPNPG
jgi:hypothetical protein